MTSKREFIVNNIANILMVDVEEVSDDCYLTDIGFSSVEMVELASAFENEFGEAMILQDMWDRPLYEIIAFMEKELDE